MRNGGGDRRVRVRCARENFFTRKVNRRDRRRFGQIPLIEKTYRLTVQFPTSFRIATSEFDQPRRSQQHAV
jgi:hypothetical protein